MLRTIQFIIALTVLIGAEILKVYFIMPFPGSQESETVSIAYFIHTNIFWFRTIGWLMLIYPLIYFFMYGGKHAKWLTVISVIIYVYVFVVFNYKFLADKMFYQPKNKILADTTSNTVPMTKLVLGVYRNGQAKAYPIEVIGYHHQVRDTFDTEPVIVTYCTVCRTGRVYSPVVDGKAEQFRLVGMDHFNAMFEDESTQSWWRQVSGEAIVGPQQGKALKEIPSSQMTLKAWLAQYPDSRIMQPDTTFKEGYKGIEDFDEGTTPSSLEKRDSLSWQGKSWIVGVQIGMHSRAYDWNHLVEKRVINDTLNREAIAIVLENDSASFHVWKRDSLELTLDAASNQLKDLQTSSTWNWQGKSIAGPQEGKKLPEVQSYQEFWHSWRTFRPQSTKYPRETGNKTNK